MPEDGRCSWNVRLRGGALTRCRSELARHVSGYKEKVLYPHNTYLELLVEHGVVGLGALSVADVGDLAAGARADSSRGAERLSRSAVPHACGRSCWAVYWVNAALVVMNYQFVNGLLFTLAGMLAAQQRRASVEGRVDARTEVWVEA